MLVLYSFIFVLFLIFLIGTVNNNKEVPLIPLLLLPIHHPTPHIRLEMVERINIVR